MGIRLINGTAWSARATPAISPRSGNEETKEMTKRHFEVIAEILRSHNASYDLAASFATYLQKENPRFDPNRFMRAAGIWGIGQPAGSATDPEEVQKLKDLYR
jgi:hypothetical protein